MDGQWLDDLEATIVRSTKNMTFVGVSIETEAPAVEAALANVRRVFDSVRKRLRPGQRFTIKVTVQPTQSASVNVAGGVSLSNKS
jgi:hypothetical protein